MIGVSGKGSAQLGQGGNQYYTYVWLRSQKSKNGPVGSPWYVGKGKGRRAYRNNGNGGFRSPPNKSFVKFFDSKGNMHDQPIYFNEHEAFELEKKMIQCYGRMNQGTGCLRNHSAGGDQPPKWQDYSKEQQEELRKKYKIAQAKMKTAKSKRVKEWWDKNRHTEKGVAALNRLKKFTGKGEKNPFFGKKHPPEVYKIIVEKRKKFYANRPYPRKGKTHTAEVRRIISQTHKGKKETPEANAKRSAAMKGRKNWWLKGKSPPNKGKKASLETRMKQSLAKKGSIPWNKGLKGVMVPWNKGLKGVMVPWNKGLKGYKVNRKKRKRGSQ